MRLMGIIPNTPAVAPFQNEPVPLEAVTTPLGEHLRLEGIRLLTGKYDSLANRARRRPPTQLERRDLDACEAAILELEAMGFERA